MLGYDLQTSTVTEGNGRPYEHRNVYFGCTSNEILALFSN